MPHRPTGITILASVFILLGIFSLVWSLILFGFGGLTWLSGLLFGAQEVRAAGGSNTMAALFSMAMAVLQIVVAGGLLGLKRWAWMLAVVAAALSVIQGIMGMMSGGLFVICFGCFGLLIPGGILWYLLRPHVKAAFGR